ncbi:Transcriptional regulator containing HTH domain,ArsR family [Halalkaliarchaeum sp. AArc-CO]|uniref:winged helix-turn-helix domain-containing protein n=1 Tax=Halalkaliarchaeum sp. AArc-CO TaxID=2866381 RepID=UPI00217E1012|nr:helix-turn-helix domain-containing protein [Halalkaliarchaeum sp. AArc-CO]UWG51614.1 Transcriptional regulator containing HTH domain,ArsR family [Halalkaliarchaeum sp. AArc-CO]
MSKQWDPDGIFEVLACKESRRILAAASVRPVTAKELDRLCDASLPTIYRRVNVLVEYDMLSEERIVGPDNEQSKQYSTDLEEIRVTVADGDVDVNVEIKKDTVEKFGELFEDLGEGHRKTSATEFPDLSSTLPEE